MNLPQVGGPLAGLAFTYYIVAMVHRIGLTGMILNALLSHPSVPCCFHCTSRSIYHPFVFVPLAARRLFNPIATLSLVAYLIHPPIYNKWYSTHGIIEVSVCRV